MFELLCITTLFIGLICVLIDYERARKDASEDVGIINPFTLALVVLLLFIGFIARMSWRTP
jgi:hypothetical protein